MAEKRDCDIIFELGCLVVEKDKMIKQLREETAELKSLLRLAVEEMTKQKLYADLGMMSRRALCKSCKTRSVTNRICQVCNYEYEHAEEALKLLGDEADD